MEDRWKVRGDYLGSPAACIRFQFGERDSNPTCSAIGSNLSDERHNLFKLRYATSQNCFAFASVRS